MPSFRKTHKAQRSLAKAITVLREFRNKIKSYLVSTPHPPFSLALSLFPFAHREAMCRALHLALQTRVPPVKGNGRAYTSAGRPCAEAMRDTKYKMGAAGHVQRRCSRNCHLEPKQPSCLCSNSTRTSL